MQYPTIAQPQYAFAPTMMAQGGSVAQNLASKGRNGDSMLVHMTPGEVGGLQALAMQHGGSLTINPQTGLPEANFLKNLLPTLLGVGLSFIPGVGPLAAGLTVGGIETVRTGDIGKGFLAGLGAYGGANLAGGLQAAGGAASSATAGATGSAEALAAEAAGNQTAAETARLTAANQAAGVGATPPTFMENVAQAGQGFQNLATGQPGSFDKFIGDAAVKADPAKGIAASPATGLGGGFGAAQTVGMAAAPSLLAPPKPYEAPVEKDEGFEYEGPYTPSQRRVSYPTDDERRRRTSEFTYFTPSNPVPFAEGGETAATPDVVVSPNEARVYQDIINTQRLAGLPALDPARFAVTPGRSYEQFVYNPIEGGGGVAQGTGEKDYGVKALSTQSQNLFGGLGTIVYRKSGSEYVPFMVTGKIDPAKYDYDPAIGGYVAKPSGNDIIRGMTSRAFGKGEAYSTGGKVSVPQLEDGGFVLTKKAVDGLGKGNNKKGQRVASAGLGAIPIKGAGAKRGPKAGVDDKIKTTIDGKRPALVSNGEAYVPKKQVAKKGGAKAFYALMHKAEKAAEKRKRS
jgi:hypothetical protein